MQLGDLIKAQVSSVLTDEKLKVVYIETLQRNDVAKVIHSTQFACFFRRTLQGKSACRDALFFFQPLDFVDRRCHVLVDSYFCFTDFVLQENYQNKRKRVRRTSATSDSSTDVKKKRLRATCCLTSSIGDKFQENFAGENVRASIFSVKLISLHKFKQKRS